MNAPQDPVCQSCAMPLARPDDFGTDAKQARVDDYCHFCYQGGAFTHPTCTLPQMIDRMSQMGDKMGLSPAEARRLAHELLPKLGRWSKPTAP